MSTVVGTCTDCIVSLPPIPPRSLSLVVKASVGNNLIRRQVGDFQGFYPANNVSEQVVQLAPASAFGPVTTGCKSLMVATDKPVTVSVTKGGVTSVLTVNSVLVLDDAYDTFTVSNSGMTANANVSIFYTN